MSEWWIVALFAWIVLMPGMAIWLGRRLRTMRDTQTRPPGDATKDLGDPVNRIRLQTMIERHELHGSVNIRDGRVLPHANAAGRSRLAVELMEASIRFSNQNLELCVRVGDQWLPLDLTLADLRLAALALED